MEEGGAQLKGVGSHTQVAVTEIVGRAVRGVQADGLLREIAVEVGHAPAKCLQRTSVGGRVGGEAPGPEHQFAVAVNVEVHAGGVRRSGVAEVGAALVGEDGPQVVLNRLHFRLGSRACPAKGLATLAAAGTAAAAPLELEVTIQVRPARVRVGAVVVVCIFAPKLARFGHLAPIGIGVQQQMDFVIIQQPGYIRVAVVIVHQVFGEARHQLGGGVFSRVNGGIDEHDRLRPGDSAIGQAQDHHVVAGIAAGGSLLPAIADVRPGGQRWVGSDNARRAGKRLLHRAIAGVAGDARNLTLQGLARPVKFGRHLGVNFQPEAGVGQHGVLELVYVHYQVAFFVVDLPRLLPGGQVGDHLWIGEVGAHDLAIIWPALKVAGYSGPGGDGQQHTAGHEEQHEQQRFARHGTSYSTCGSDYPPCASGEACHSDVQ